MISGRDGCASRARSNRSCAAGKIVLMKPDKSQHVCRLHVGRIEPERFGQRRLGIREFVFDRKHRTEQRVGDGEFRRAGDRGTERLLRIRKPAEFQ